MNHNTILIVYSVKGTEKVHQEECARAIRSFKRSSGAATKCQPHLFDIPSSAEPGGSLSSELYKVLRRSAGAVVFVDDMRPNIIYEVGVIHGQGRPVLLLTQKQVEDFWKSVSDLAGSSVGNFGREPIRALVHRYLDNLHEHLSRIPAWPLSRIPEESLNFLPRLRITPVQTAKPQTPWGIGVQINGWSLVECYPSLNLTNEARYDLILKGARESTAYTVYFRILYCNTGGERKTIWIGLTCNDSSTDIGDTERTVPAQRIGTSWCFITGSFMDLLMTAVVLDVHQLEHLEIVRFRGGKADDRPQQAFVVGYMNITGTRA